MAEDNRTPEEKATAQRALVKIMAIATFFPLGWSLVLAWDIVQKIDEVEASEVGFAYFMATTGLLGPLVWLGSYGYALNNIRKGKMEAGSFAPIIPALWAVFWFAALFTR